MIRDPRAALEDFVTTLPYKAWAVIPGNRIDARKIEAEIAGERRRDPGSRYAQDLVSWARAFPPSVPAPPVSQLAPIWQRDAVWTTALSSFDGARRDPAKARGFGVVYVQLLHAVNAVANETEIPVFTREGWDAVGWGTYGQNTDPYHDGLEAAGITLRLPVLQGWKANGELWAEGPGRPKTAAFLEGWRDGGAKVPLGWSVLSSDTASFARPFDFATALSVQGADIDAQVYGATNSGYTVGACLGMLNKVPVPVGRTAMSFDISRLGVGPFANYRTWPGPRRVWVGEWSNSTTWKALDR